MPTLIRPRPARLLNCFLSLAVLASAAKGLLAQRFTLTARVGGTVSASGLAFDCAGNLFEADDGTHVIRKITSAGVVTTWAGSERPLGGGLPESESLP